MRAGRYLIALAGVSVFAAGCGTVHAGTSGAPGTFASAVSNTAAQTARITITEAIAATGMSMSFTQTGEFDFAHSRGMLSMTAPADMTELFVPPKVYLKFSGMGSLPNGKAWVAVGAQTMGEGGMLGPFGTGDNPADMLTSLTAIAGSERILGPASVRGVPVTEYQVNIDPVKAAAKVPASERASFRQFTQSLGLGKGAVPVDVWVDGQNRVRQIRMSLHLPGVGDSFPANARLTQTIDFYDFGLPVQVSAPPAAQVDSEPGLNPGEMIVGSVSASAAVSPLPVASLVPGSAGTASAAASVVPPPPLPVSASPFPAQG